VATNRADDITDANAYWRNLLAIRDYEGCNCFKGVYGSKDKGSGVFTIRNIENRTVFTLQDKTTKVFSIYETKLQADLFRTQENSNVNRIYAQIKSDQVKGVYFNENIGEYGTVSGGVTKDSEIIIGLKQHRAKTPKYFKLTENSDKTIFNVNHYPKIYSETLDISMTVKDQD
jgi:hypothetical protein